MLIPLHVSQASHHPLEMLAPAGANTSYLRAAVLAERGGPEAKRFRLALPDLEMDVEIRPRGAATRIELGSTLTLAATPAGFILVAARRPCDACM